MRIIPFFISAIITCGIIYALNRKWGSIPPIGKFLSPQFGIWQNAEPSDINFDGEFKFPNLKGKVEVIMDERLVPHVFAENDEDAYFVQGYLHAKFRLWQMEFQTHAAAGRISEIIGARAIDFDREQRRLGMVYGAKNMVKAIEANEKTRRSTESYTAGVNAFIENLKESELPLEYKLLGYKPEKWTTLKTALFVKQMAKTLAGYQYSNDMHMTSLLSIFSGEELKLLFPDGNDSLSPVIPTGTIFPPPSIIPIVPASADSIYFSNKDSIALNFTPQHNTGTGSNNWAVSGSKTQSGAPILCNDPHLELSFPSIWYELQIHTPNYNAYGVSFPGIPGIVIGFNDSIAFGFTNGGIDVMDFYEIRFRDEKRIQYWFNGSWTDTRHVVEEIKVRNGKTVYDTVAYTLFGPVMYDNSFSTTTINGKSIAVRWKAHDSSNELLMWWYLNRAKNYDEYAASLGYFSNPVQNIVFASKKGDIAIWQQGEIPARWKGQGMYIMPGYDSNYLWQAMIPQQENPHVLNPGRGFVSSANQLAVDSTYPYYLPGDYAVYRGKMINRLLDTMQQIVPADMMRMQSNNHNLMAEIVRPFLLKHIRENSLNNDEKRMLGIFKNWNLQNNYEEKGATIFNNWFDTLYVKTWDDEFSKVKEAIVPDRATLADLLLRDSSLKYLDNINTTKKETADDIVTESFRVIVPSLLKMEKEKKLEWGNFKNTTIYHLLRTSVVPFAMKGIQIGGGQEIINATKHTNGPSWRMVVHLTSNIEAYGVYPGGQSGNPGSRHYNDFVDQWAAGKYYNLWFMRAGDKTDKRVKWRMVFTK